MNTPAQEEARGHVADWWKHFAGTDEQVEEEEEDRRRKIEGGERRRRRKRREGRKLYIAEGKRKIRKKRKGNSSKGRERR